MEVLGLGPEVTADLWDSNSRRMMGAKVCKQRARRGKHGQPKPPAGPGTVQVPGNQPEGAKWGGGCLESGLGLF